jgi:hypothetical protein
VKELFETTNVVSLSIRCTGPAGNGGAARWDGAIRNNPQWLWTRSSAIKFNVANMKDESGKPRKCFNIYGTTNADDLQFSLYALRGFRVGDYCGVLQGRARPAPKNRAKAVATTPFLLVRDKGTPNESWHNAAIVYNRKRGCPLALARRSSVKANVCIKSNGEACCIKTIRHRDQIIIDATAVSDGDDNREQLSSGGDGDDSSSVNDDDDREQPVPTTSQRSAGGGGDDDDDDDDDDGKQAVPTTSKAMVVVVVMPTTNASSSVVVATMTVSRQCRQLLSKALLQVVTATVLEAANVQRPHHSAARHLRPNARKPSWTSLLWRKSMSWWAAMGGKQVGRGEFGCVCVVCCVKLM